MGKMIGAIYAVPIILIDQLFDGKNKVFVKCTGQQSTKLLPKHKIVFYGSHGEKKLIGEGIIKKVEFLNPEEVISKYKEELFIDEQQFRQYVGKRQRILTLELKGLKKYQEPIQIKEVITMAGKYLTAEQYDSIVNNKK
jgi:hypothetical protein